MLQKPNQKKDKQGNNKRSGGPNKQPQGQGPQWGKASKSLLFWTGLFIVALLISQQFSGGQGAENELNYNQFMSQLEAGKIEKITIKDKVVTGEYIQSGQAEEAEKFKVVLTTAPDFETLEKWRNEHDIAINVKENTPGFWHYLFTALPWILLIGFWIFLIRRMNTGGGGQKGIFNFGKSRAKMINENYPKVTFDDVAGAEEAKQELQQIIEFLKEPERFQNLGGKIPKGALLLGPPGTGKTLLAKAVSGEAGAPFFSMSGADFVEMFVGVGASRVRDLFEQGKRNAPCLIFIDELDAVGRQRGAGLGGGHDEREQTLNQLLVEMDGFDPNEGVIVIAATNRPDVLDSALLRPGRFDRQIVVNRPDVRGREGILKVHIKNIPTAKNVELEVLAKGTPGFSGADLANMVNEAALLAARKGKKRVGMEDLEEAKDKVFMGTERRSLLISDDEKKTIAYHEAGHALVAKLTRGSDPIHKVTIIPRGRALGATMTLPLDERHNYTKSYCLAMMRQLLGGRCAEKLVFNELTTGAGDDIKKATQLARKMVCEWGMSDVLGPLTYGEKKDEIFLGREISQHRDYSEETAQIIDKEIRKLVEDAFTDVDSLLQENEDKLHDLTNALLVRESLDGREVEKIINGEKLPPLKKAKKKSSSSKKKSKKTEPAETTSN